MPAGVPRDRRQRQTTPARGLPAASKPAEPPRAETVRPRQPLTRRAEKPLDFSNGFEKNLIGFLKSFWKVWKNFGVGFALR